MPSQRPFFLSTFFAAFRQPAPAPLSTQAAASKQPSSAATTTSAAARSMSTSATPSTTSAVAAAAAAAAAPATSTTQPPRQGGIASQLPLHSPRAVPIPGASAPAGRRRGSDSSSEGFRDVRGADKWYIGGRTAGGEEKFFRLGVVRRVRSGDRLSLDRLSL